MHNPWDTGPTGINPANPYPLQGQQQGGPFQQQGPMNPMQRFASSPWMNMAAAGANNMNNMAMGRPTQNPIAAYQQAVAAQSVANQNKRQHEQAMQVGAQNLKKGELGIEQAEQNLDPFYKYNEAKKQKLIPDTMSYAEFLKIGGRTIDTTSPIKNMERRGQLQSAVTNATTPEEREAAEAELKVFDNYVRAPQMYAAGGGQQERVGAGGESDVLVGAGTATGREANLAGSKTTAQEQAKTREEQVRGGLTGARQSREAYKIAEDMLTVTDEYLSKFDGKGDDDIDTGFVNGMMLNIFGIGSEELGSMNADSIATVLQNLQITNLAPVTEKEIALVMQMWADISKSESVNKGTLTRAKKRTERLMDMIKEDAIYDAGIVQEYGSPEQYKALLRSNPFANELMNPKEETQVDF
jgi:hypothetical protein